jgi:hypothetical protein
MIKKISEDEAGKLRERLSMPAKRIEVFPENSQYGAWIDRISIFLSLNEGDFVFGVEEYRGELEFFESSIDEVIFLIFLSSLIPIEMVLFGPEWIIGVSSYPDSGAGAALEYSLRFYGRARGLGVPGP